MNTRWTLVTRRKLWLGPFWTSPVLRVMLLSQRYRNIYSILSNQWRARTFSILKPINRLCSACFDQLFSEKLKVFQLDQLEVSNCVSGSSKFDIAFLTDCTKFCNVFSGYWIGNLLRIPKMCLKLSFSYLKWVLQAILSLTVVSTVFLSVQSLTPLFSLMVPNFVVSFLVIG